MQGRTQTIPTGPVHHVVRVTQPVRAASLVVAVEPARIPTGRAAAKPTAKVPATAARVPEPSAPVENVLAKQVAATLDAIETAVHETESRRQESLDELRLVAVEMSVAIASRVVGDSISAGNSGIEELVTDAITKFAGSDSITIALNPVDFEQLNKAMEGRAPPWPEAAKPRLVADNNVARGGCEVNGADFHYVARMELVLDEIRVGLMESLEHAQIERRRTQATGSGLRRFPDRRETA